MNPPSLLFSQPSVHLAPQLYTITVKETSRIQDWMWASCADSTSTLVIFLDYDFRAIVSPVSPNYLEGKFLFV